MIATTKYMLYISIAMLELVKTFPIYFSAYTYRLKTCAN